MGRATRSKSISATRQLVAPGVKARIERGAMAATGAVALYFVEDITTDERPPDAVESLVFESPDLADEYDDLTDTAETDLVVFGCPHSSVE